MAVQISATALQFPASTINSSANRSRSVTRFAGQRSAHGDGGHSPADNGPVGINSLLPAPANTPSIVASTVSPLSPVIPTRISPAGRSQEILTRPLHGQAVAAPRQTAPPNSGIFILDDSGVTPQGQASQTLRASAKQTSILAAKPAKHPLPVGASKHPLPKPKVDAPAHQAGG